jgi:hypothetical protein
MTQDGTMNHAPQQSQDDEQRLKNTEVEWFKQHVRIAKRLERAAKRLEAQRQKEQGTHDRNS